MESGLPRTALPQNCGTFKSLPIVSTACTPYCSLAIKGEFKSKLKIFYVVSVHLVDIWNVIEAFRENGLNTMEPKSDVSVSRLETLVSSLYHNLNKRLTTAQQVPVDSKASLLLNWLIAAYSHDNSGKMRVFSIKVALAIMCAGKLVDKLRCKYFH